jgi:flagella basal body P-ring formation protein FlgA
MNKEACSFFEKKEPKKLLRVWAEPLRQDRSQINQKFFASFFQKSRPCFLLAGLLAAGTAQAALLRPYTEISSGTVHLGDLFDQLGSTPDRALGRAPAPGEKIVVEAPQLAAIARDFGVDWRPSSGAERSVLQRRGQQVPASLVRECLLTALRAAGAPADGDVFMPTFEPPMIGAGVTPKLAATQVSYDVLSGRFTALLQVQDGESDMPALRLSGQVISMRDAATLTRRMSVGVVLTAADVQAVRVRAGVLHGQMAMLPAQAVGMALKHDVSPGLPLLPGDLMRPVVVARGSAVHMVLESEGLSLSAMGVALEAGGVGDRIRVQNPTSHVVVEGEVTAAGTLRVSPAPESAVSLAARR